MIYYLTPFCPQKRLGHIHNKYCELVTNPEDYICLLDPDVMFLHPHQQSWIQDIVDKHGDDWDLLGCMANRIGNEENKGELIFSYYDGINSNIWQQLFDIKPNEMSLNYCRFNSNAHYHSYHDSIKEANITAGFFMLFKRSLWDKIKFKEGINFDIKFCEAVKKKGGRIGIMKGIYVYHDYRSWSKNPKTDKKHLL